MKKALLFTSALVMVIAVDSHVKAQNVSSQQWQSAQPNKRDTSMQDQRNYFQQQRPVRQAPQRPGSLINDVYSQNEQSGGFSDSNFNPDYAGDADLRAYLGDMDPPPPEMIQESRQAQFERDFNNSSQAIDQSYDYDEREAFSNDEINNMVGDLTRVPESRTSPQPMMPQGANAFGQMSEQMPTLQDMENFTGVYQNQFDLDTNNFLMTAKLFRDKCKSDIATVENAGKRVLSNPKKYDRSLLEASIGIKRNLIDLMRDSSENALAEFSKLADSDALLFKSYRNALGSFDLMVKNCHKASSEFIYNNNIRIISHPFPDEAKQRVFDPKVLRDRVKDRFRGSKNVSTNFPGQEYARYNQYSTEMQNFTNPKAQQLTGETPTSASQYQRPTEKKRFKLKNPFKRTQ